MASVPPFVLIGTAVICLGDLLHIIGLATPHWTEVDFLLTKGSVGLFEACNDKKCDSIENPSSKLEACQAMAILGMLCGLAAGAVALLFVIMNLLSKSVPKLFSLICVAGCGAAFLFIMIGVIIYGADIYDSDVGDLGYSFGLSIVGAILLGVGGGLVFMGGKSMS